MILYRVFDWDGHSKGSEIGGPYHVPRRMQGAGRFDLPQLDGILYASHIAVGAVAEFLQGFRMRSISNRHFQRPDCRRKALIGFTLPEDTRLVDLDDAGTLVRLGIQPSQVLTRNREVTHPLAERLHHEGAQGILMPSALEGSGKNAALFDSRTKAKLRSNSAIEWLTIKHPVVQEAAKVLSIPLTPRVTVRRK